MIGVYIWRFDSMLDGPGTETIGNLGAWRIDGFAPLMRASHGTTLVVWQGRLAIDVLHLS